MEKGNLNCKGCSYYSHDSWCAKYFNHVENIDECNKIDHHISQFKSEKQYANLKVNREPDYNEKLAFGFALMTDNLNE